MLYEFVYEKKIKKIEKKEKKTNDQKISRYMLRLAWFSSSCLNLSRQKRSLTEQSGRGFNLYEMCHWFQIFDHLDFDF